MVHESWGNLDPDRDMDHGSWLQPPTTFHVSHGADGGPVCRGGYTHAVAPSTVMDHVTWVHLHPEHQHTTVVIYEEADQYMIPY